MTFYKQVVECRNEEILDEKNTGGKNVLEVEWGIWSSGRKKGNYLLSLLRQQNACKEFVLQALEPN